MRRSHVVVLVIAVVAALCAGLGGLGSASGAAAPPGKDPLDAYTATVEPDAVAGLAAQGYDVSDQTPAGAKTKVGLVLDKAQAKKLRGQGVDLALTRVKGGQTVRQFAAAQAAGGYTVWRSYDEPGGIRDQMYAVARANPQIAKLVKARHHAPGPRDPRDQAHPGRPRAGGRLAPGGPLQRHPARPRVDRHRGQPPADDLLRRPLERQRPLGPQAPAVHRALVHAGAQPRRLPVHVRHRAAVAEEPARQQRRRPDHQVGDGVDPNRNFPSHWGYDNEGSSPIPSSDTYRGPSAGVRAGDAGDGRPVRPDRLRVHGQLPLQRPVAALQRRLADRHADRGRPDLLRDVRQPRQAGDRGLPPGPELRRPLRHQR